MAVAKILLFYIPLASLLRRYFGIGKINSFFFRNFCYCGTKAYNCLRRKFLLKVSANCNFDNSVLPAAMAIREQERVAKCAARCRGAEKVNFWGAGVFFLVEMRGGVLESATGLQVARGSLSMTWLRCRR